MVRPSSRADTHRSLPPIKRKQMTGSSEMHVEVRPSMLSSDRIALTQHSGELPHFSGFERPCGPKHSLSSSVCASARVCVFVCGAFGFIYLFSLLRFFLGNQQTMRLFVHASAINLLTHVSCKMVPCRYSHEGFCFLEPAARGV